MSLEDALAILNTMQIEGVISEYAIGGAVAAFLYIEPGTTFDLDVFIAWEAGPGGLLDLGPIYAYLLKKGYIAKGEAVAVSGWDVRFLPPNSLLVEEALEQAESMMIKGIPTRVFTKEHLMAICLETERPKDLARLVQFVQEGESDEKRFAEIVGRHNLQMKWLRFQNRFLRPL